MKYRIDPKSGNKLSILGFGCMRLPRGINAKIDIGKSENLILSAIEQGVNYFDTAYVYAGSEQVLGEILQKNKGVREKIYIATKLPFGQCKTYEDFDRIFTTQLELLNTDYIDYYLIHALYCVSDWDRIRALGIEKWFAEKKASGQIRQAGFSFHGIQSEFMALLDEYDWDFCMIQYNYINENYQAGRAGLQRAHEKGLPVMVMEPLLGGKLATGLPNKAVKLLSDANSNRTPAQWSLRWLWNHPEVTLTLSGMNAEGQLADNIKAAQTAEPGVMGVEELAAIEKVVGVFKESYRIPCTGCNYCLPCPKDVNIPGSFAAYNTYFASGMMAGFTQYITSTGANKPKNYSSKNCVKCGLCEKQCPQQIDIIKDLETVLKKMEPFWFSPAMKLINKIMG
jgi:predicted aldo/keto reductase-like oxidoreductase